MDLKFFESQNLSGPRFILGPKIIFDPKSFWPEHFVPPKILLDLKYFLMKIILDLKRIFGPYIFGPQIWTQTFCDQQCCLARTFL